MHARTHTRSRRITTNSLALESVSETVSRSGRSTLARHSKRNPMLCAPRNGLNSNSTQADQTLKLNFRIFRPQEEPISENKILFLLLLRGL